MRLRVLYAGESHGPTLVAIVEGLPAGLALDRAAIDRDLARRQGGYGRGGRMKIECDAVEIVSGLRHGETLGSPLALEVRNSDHANWIDAMAPWGERGSAADEKRVKRPRPGHVDLAGGLKYNRRDLRDVLERASARETAARVAVGAIAKQLLRLIGVDIVSHVTRVGRAVLADAARLDSRDLAQASEASDMRCIDPAASAAMHAEVDRARHERDTVGGVFEVVARGVLPGLGSHVQWDRRLDARLAAAVMSIPAVKAVEIGMGMRVAEVFGSAVHDPIGYSARRFSHPTNNAGGIEGGISNGEEIVARGAMKPISTLPSPLASVDIDTKQPLSASYERSDTCAVPAASVIGEAVVAWVLAEAVMEKFGGDSIGELQRNVDGYRAQLEAY